MGAELGKDGDLFSLPSMLAEASAETGLDDFGDEEFREALTRLIDSTNREAVLSPVGVEAIKAEVHRILVNRLRFAEDLKRHPEILDEDVTDPIVIVGMPRTGSSKLQRMLAADPDTQRLEHWRLFNPAPLPNAVAGQEDPRIAVSRQVVDMIPKMMPGWMESHPTGTHEVDEDVFLQLYTFKSVLTCMARPTPSFQAWMANQSRRGTYQYTRKLLQYLQWQDGGKHGRPWIMKSPVHMGSIDLILEQHPKATLVFTHRSVHEIIASDSRLIEASWRLYSDVVDRKALGRKCLDDWALEMKNHLRLRESLGPRLEILDVRYEQIRDDPFSAIREIYRRAGRELTPRREQAMRAWEAKQTHVPAGKNAAKLEDYGLTARDIDLAFSDYLGRFGR